VELQEEIWLNRSTEECRPWIFLTREWVINEKIQAMVETWTISRSTPHYRASLTCSSDHLHSRRKTQRILASSERAGKVQIVSHQPLRKWKIQWSLLQVVKSQGKNCLMLHLDCVQQSRILKQFLTIQKIFKWFRTVITSKLWKWGWRVDCHQTQAVP